MQSIGVAIHGVVVLGYALMDRVVAALLAMTNTNELLLVAPCHRKPMVSISVAIH